MEKKENLHEVKKDLEIKLIHRKAKLKAWEEYLEFFIPKIIGIILILLGGIEFFHLSVLPVVLPADPLIFVGGGFGLLFGGKIVNSILEVIRR